MPRVVKHPDIRREELLSIAGQLFAERGYERTSIDDIIGQAGLSKGAFYYYYPSKDALLEALAAQVAAASLASTDQILARPGLTALERLQAFLRGGRQEDGGAAVSMFGSIFRPENLSLYHRLHAAVTAVVLHPLTQIVDQGVAEGSFATEDAQTTAEIILLLGAVTHDLVANCLAATDDASRAIALAAFERRLVQQAIAIDRILGLRDGTIRLVDPGQAGRLVGW